MSNLIFLYRNIASQNLQDHLNSEWRIKINPQKSHHITFTLRKISFPPVFLNRTQLPFSGVVKYLGLYIDKRFTWNPHTQLKRQEVNVQYRLLLRLLDNRSHLPLKNKLLLYSTLLRPMWAYGIKLWGSAKPSNISKIQTLHSKILRKITNAPNPTKPSQLRPQVSYVVNHAIENKLYVLYFDLVS
jgi:hypothetical protein